MWAKGGIWGQKGEIGVPPILTTLILGFTPILGSFPPILWSPQFDPTPHFDASDFGVPSRFCGPPYFDPPDIGIPLILGSPRPDFGVPPRYWGPPHFDPPDIGIPLILGSPHPDIGVPPDFGVPPP